MCGPVVKEFLQVAMEDRPKLDFKAPEEAVMIKVDRATGVRLPDDASGPNVAVEAFREFDVPPVGSHTGGLVLGEGLFGFSIGGGGDLPMTADEASASEPLTPVGGEPDGGAAPRPPKPSSFGSGGLY